MGTLIVRRTLGNQQGSESLAILLFRISDMNLIKKSWVFIRVLQMDPNNLGFWDQGFLIRFLH